MARKHLKPGALTAPLPPVLVTVGVGDEANIITIGWTGILSTHPPRTYISVRPERHSHGLLCRHGEFVVNLTTAHMAREVDYCGIYTGAKVDKFKECRFTRAESAEVAVPSIAECPLSIECRVIEVKESGTHDVFVADIVGVSCDESMLDGEGRLCFDKANLLAYAHGEYFALGEKVGTFGFSTKKEKPAARKQASAKEGKASKPHPSSKENGAANAERKPKNTKSDGERKPKNTKPSGDGDGHRPFYLDAPRGRSKRKGKR